ncbi:MAG: hypothetical protein H7A21_06270 [Spirochaetales bacterium]|nr:hypothetical protein [Leptospiraceae bacterium]MCP5481017.1 hypothetical protein [Spirochaetales bacterium]MCP5485397.1 hypothetical protein [Spirochaetales bacterium]
MTRSPVAETFILPKKWPLYAALLLLSAGCCAGAFVTVNTFPEASVRCPREDVTVYWTSSARRVTGETIPEDYRLIVTEHEIILHCAGRPLLLIFAFSDAQGYRQEYIGVRTPAGETILAETTIDASGAGGLRVREVTDQYVYYSISTVTPFLSLSEAEYAYNWQTGELLCRGCD